PSNGQFDTSMFVWWTPLKQAGEQRRKRLSGSSGAHQDVIQFQQESQVDLEFGCGKNQGMKSFAKQRFIKPGTLERSKWLEHQFGDATHFDFFITALSQNVRVVCGPVQVLYRNLPRSRPKLHAYAAGKAPAAHRVPSDQVGGRQRTAGTQHPERLTKKGFPGDKMKGGLQGKNSVKAVGGKR